MKEIKYKVRFKSGYLDEYVFVYGTIEEANDLVETAMNNLAAPEKVKITIEPFTDEEEEAESDD